MSQTGCHRQINRQLQKSKQQLFFGGCFEKNRKTDPQYFLNFWVSQLFFVRVFEEKKRIVISKLFLKAAEAATKKKNRTMLTFGFPNWSQRGSKKSQMFFWQHETKNYKKNIGRCDTIFFLPKSGQVAKAQPLALAGAAAVVVAVVVVVVVVDVDVVVWHTNDTRLNRTQSKVTSIDFLSSAKQKQTDFQFFTFLNKQLEKIYFEFFLPSLSCSGFFFTIERSRCCCCCRVTSRSLLNKSLPWQNPMKIAFLWKL